WVELANQGTLVVSQPLTIARNNSAHTNTGTINVSGANLTITQSGTVQSFSNTGVLDISAGRSLLFNSGTLGNTGSGIIRGSGILNVSTTFFTNGATLSPGPAGGAGALQIVGSITNNASATHLIELGGLIAGT